MISHEPNEQWSLDELGRFCQARTKRMAKDAWATGKAMALAKMKTTHGEFTAWKRKWGYSDAKVSRYMRLYEEHKTADSLDGKGIMAALRAADIVAPKPQKPPTHQPQAAVSKARAVRSVPPKKGQPAPLPPWAVADSTNFGSHEEDEDHEAEPDATTDTMLRLEIEKLPYCFEVLKKQIDWIAAQDKEVRIRVWPAEQSEQIRADSEGLQAALQKLEGMIPA